MEYDQNRNKQNQNQNQNQSKDPKRDQKDQGINKGGDLNKGQQQRQNQSQQGGKFDSQDKNKSK